MKVSKIIVINILFLTFIYCGSENQADSVVNRTQESASSNIDGRNQVHLAVLKGNIEETAELIKNGHNVNLKDNYGFTPLHYAAKNGNLRLIELLLDNKADLNAQNKYLETSLHCAALKGHYNAVEFLSGKGADLFAVDRDGKTASQAAVEAGFIELTRFLNPLHVAAGKGDTAQIEAILNSSPEMVNLQDGFSKTPLHWAVKYDKIDAINLLLAKNADPNLKDRYGYTPDYYSAQNRKMRIGIDRLTPFMVDKVDQIVYEELNKYSHINVGLVHNGEAVYTKSYGKSKLNKSFSYGSVSKSVTAILVMFLFEQGEIESLDDNIWKYSSQYRNSMPSKYANAPLTIKHLLLHSSGIPHNNEPTWKEGKLNLKFRPGERDLYSTSGFGILGHVIEDITGLTFNQAVSKYIGMPSGAPSFWAEDHFRAPGARIHSTIKDMSLFSIGVINNTFLSADMFYNTMLKRNGPSINGIGWTLPEIEGDNITIFHGGSNGRPQAYLIIKPKKKISVSILATAKDGESFYLNTLASDLMEILLASN